MDGCNMAAVIPQSQWSQLRTAELAPFRLSSTLMKFPPLAVISVEPKSKIWTAAHFMPFFGGVRMVYYGTRLSENISRRDSATSIGATVHWTDRLFRLSSALTKFLPLAVVRAEPTRDGSDGQR